MGKAQQQALVCLRARHGQSSRPHRLGYRYLHAHLPCFRRHSRLLQASFVRFSCHQKSTLDPKSPDAYHGKVGFPVIQDGREGEGSGEGRGEICEMHIRRWYTASLADLVLHRNRDKVHMRTRTHEDRLHARVTFSCTCASRCSCIFACWSV